MGCEVLVGTQQTYRRCELPGRRRRDGHDVCVFHWLFQRDLPFEGERLLSAAEVNRRHWW